MNFGSVSERCFLRSGLVWIYLYHDVGKITVGNIKLFFGVCVRSEIYKMYVTYMSEKKNRFMIDECNNILVCSWYYELVFKYTEVQ